MFGKLLGKVPVIGEFAKGVYDTGATAVDDVTGAASEGAEDYVNSLRGQDRTKFVAPEREDVQIGQGVGTTAAGLYGDANARGQAADDVAAGYRNAGSPYGGMSGSLYKDAMSRDVPVQESQYYSDNEGQSRAYQQAGLDLTTQAAMGLAPSEAAYQMQRGLDQASAAQNSMQGSARGAAAIANAQGNATSNIAGLQQGVFTDAGQLRAQEMAQARGMMGTQSQALRGMDQGRLNSSNEFGLANRSMGNQQQLGLLAASQGYGGLDNSRYSVNQNAALGNAQLGQGYYEQGLGVARNQSTADASNRDAAQTNQKWQQEQQAGVDRANTQKRQQTGQMIGAAVSTQFGNAVNTANGIANKPEKTVFDVGGEK
jgi:hypothetical protein